MEYRSVSYKKRQVSVRSNKYQSKVMWLKQFFILPAESQKRALRDLVLNPVAAVLFFCLSSSWSLAACDVSNNSVICSGNSGALIIPQPPGPSVTVDVSGMLNGGITITDIPDVVVTNNGSINGNISVASGNNFTFSQNGIFGSTDINVNSTGTNAFLVNTGYSVRDVAMVGENNIVDNSGTFNTNMNLTATENNTIINRAGGQFNSVELLAPYNVIDNFGTFNDGLHFTSDSINAIQNQNTGIIHGITATGSSGDQIRNEGRINGLVSSGEGDDWYISLNNGTLSGNVDLGAGNDIFYMENGLVTASVNLGSGDDRATVLNGTLSADFQADDGADQFDWAGGIIQAGIDMGAGDDRADFYNLTPSNLLTGERIGGGTGNDTLVWHDTIGGDVSRFTHWEFIELVSHSQMTFSDYSTLTMGDSGTGTGTLSVDSTSTISAGNGIHTIAPAISGQLVNVYNAGVIDLTNSQQTMTDRFTVTGNYIGVNGNLNLQTYLGDDSSPSDQLVIRGNGARAAGDTLINITNVGGPGAMTNGNGIRVIDIDQPGNASSDVSSFALGGRVAVGMYEYALFRGGVGADSGDNDWYLRSGVPVGITPTVPVVPSTPVQPSVPAPVPQPPATLPVIPPPLTSPSAPSGAVPPLPLPVPVAPSPLPVTPAPVQPELLPPAPSESLQPPPQELSEQPVMTPLVRPEIPGYVIAPAVVHRMGILALDKFHARQGDQSLLNNVGILSGAWGRFFGQSTGQKRSSRIDGHGFQLAPEFDGNIWGLQTGVDILGGMNDAGAQKRVGLFYNHTEARGDILGNILARQNARAGRLKIDGDGIGTYWTYIRDDGGYVDVVGMLNRFHGEANSGYHVGADISGHSALLSLEGGYPFMMAKGWTLEPQAQLIWQRVDLDDTHDRYSDVGYDTSRTWTGRLGVRLENNMTVNSRTVRPFADLDLWHNFSSTYGSQFNGGSLTTQMESTSLELRTGISAQISDNVSTHAALQYITDPDGNDGRSLGGNIGFRLSW